MCASEKRASEKRGSENNLSSNATTSAEPLACKSPSDTLPKVLHYYLDFGSVGGIETFLPVVCQALLQRGQFDPVVVCNQDTPLMQRLQSVGVRTLGLPLKHNRNGALNKTATKYANVPKLTRILLEEKPALVHVHLGRIEQLYLKALGFPLVYSFHGYGEHYNPSLAKGWAQRLLHQIKVPFFRWMVPYLDALLLVSRAEQQRLAEQGYLPAAGPHQPLAGDILYNGVQVAMLAEQASRLDRDAKRAALNIPPTAPCMASIARLSPEKNSDRLVEVAERMAQQPGLEALHLIIAGDGPLRPTVLQQIAESPRREYIHYLGNRSDVIELYALSDLALSLSSYEPFGISVLEAMATSTPVAAFAAGGIQEVLPPIADYPLIVPNGNYDQLVARAAAYLTQTPERQRQVQQQIFKQALEFDVERTVVQLEATYGRVLQRTSRR
ncbi:MAG: glycosyltransferase family 4 protein [Candidatus Melainabacteria bacterium]|nr:glycosyltransferase family 4 protein [Candidatus Melainabacteria bacterium]